MKLQNENIGNIRKRGRPPKNKEETSIIPISNESNRRKYKVTHEGLDTIAVWEYNLDIFDKGPVEVNIKYKENVKYSDSNINKEKYKKRKEVKRRGRPKK